MTEPEDFLQRVPVVPLEPDTGRLDALRSAVARRRAVRRQAGIAAGTALAVAVLGFTVLRPSADRNRLGVTTPRVPTASVQAQPSTRPPPSPTALNVTPSVPPPSVTASAPDVPGTTQSPGPRSANGPLDRSYGYYPTATCDEGGFQGGQTTLHRRGRDGFCVIAAANGRALEVRACRPGADGSGRLSFEYALEADLVIRDSAGRVRWHWSRGAPAGGRPHQLAGEPGSCWSWSFSWDGRDDGGVRVPPGDYTVTGTVLAANLGEANTHQVTLSVS